MATGTNISETVTLERNARLLRDSFTRCRRDVSIPQRDAQIRNLIKRVENGRVHLAEHMVILAWDAFHRGAPQPDVEEPGHKYVLIVRDWFEARARGENVEIPEMIRRAIEAQTAATNAEVACLVQPCPKTYADVEDALKREILEAERAIGALHDQQFAARQAA
jgi:hypothetical protein